METIKVLTITQSKFIKRVLNNNDNKWRDRYKLRSEQTLKLNEILYVQRYDKKDGELLNRIGDWYKKRQN